MKSGSKIRPKARARRRNWLELPTEVMSMILVKLGAIEILTNAQNVCSLWRKICKDPLMWRVINMQNLWGLEDFDDFDYMNSRLEIMCRHAVGRSCGQLLDISIDLFGTDHLLQYIAQSSNQLRTLRISVCPGISNRGMCKAVSKFPLLEQLEILFCPFSVKTLKTVGHCCPLLKSLKLIQEFCTGERRVVSDEEALAIAETMPKLRHLHIFGNALTDKGLQAILDGCPDLESLDLAKCLNLKLVGQLKKKCAERINNLHLPYYEFS